MPNRRLRIVKRVRNTPVLGVCESCSAQFAGDPNRGNAQSAIQEQFNAHQCKALEAVPEPVKTVKKATASK